VKRPIIVIDTSILTVHLRLPGHVRCGPQEDEWDYVRIETHLNTKAAQGALFVLPLAAIIETAKHISQSVSSRFDLANELAERVRSSVDGKQPWVSFSEQGNLWGADSLSLLVQNWPTQAEQRLSLADVSISEVANFYARLGHPVEILTGDQGLKSMEPLPPRLPRRRGDIRVKR
jgi:hypothetical protein